MKITYFKSEWDTYTPEELSLDVTWPEVAEMLTTFIKIDKKEDTEMYNLWEFKIKDGQIHRCKDDCIALHGLVLDYDQNLSLKDAIEQFSVVECVIYTTFNHGLKGFDKYRVVIPFKTPMPVEEFNKKRESMIETFTGVDRASFSRSQAIFLHSGPDPSLKFSIHLTGEFLDWTAFDDEIIEPVEYSTEPQEENLDPDFIKAYRVAMMDSLKSCTGIRHMKSLSLVILLKSCGANFNDYRAIVAVAGARDSCIQDPNNQRETWAVVPDDVKIKKTKRDKFIADHSGKPIDIKRTNILIQKIKRLKGELRDGSKD